MKAVTWQGRRDIQVKDVPDPRIQDPTDAIIKITSTAICGSDLHLYEIMTPFMQKGDIMGHEPLGVVQEVGANVKKLRPGDRVVVSFNIACGRCFMCKRGLTSQCETTQVREHNRGAALFGYTKLYGHIPGGQAEYLRVPHADYTAKKIPQGPSDDRFLYLSDILPTAWQALDYAGIKKGDTVAVLGLGPIGDMAVRIALHHGAKKVIAVDLVPERLKRAGHNGADTIDWRDFEDDTQGLAAAIRDKTAGRGPDAVIDAVGMEAHGSHSIKAIQDATNILPSPVAEKLFTTAGIDRINALRNAIEIVRRGGTISLSGVYAGQIDPIPMDALFDKQIQLRMGQANAAHLADKILPLLLKDNLFGVEEFATHHMPLDQAAHAYDIFQKKQDGAIKIVLHP